MISSSLSHAFKFLAMALGFFKALLQWFRERSIHDAGVNAERLRVMEAERKANEKAENVKPVGPDDVIERLRGTGDF